MSKTRAHDTLSFRPENADQERFINDAQAATGMKMADLLRRAVLLGLPTVVKEVRQQREEALAMFERHLTRDDPDHGAAETQGDNVLTALELARRKAKRAKPH